ncbi:transposase [Streptomyces sp. NPDC059616]|uniref:transposase n=1 Tax=Streptomyces sp. NPDC059616 TaxID=3346886 RepID=UPI003697D994
MARQAHETREVRRGKLAEAIKQIFEGSGGTYGSPKVWIRLLREGWRVSVNTLAKTHGRARPGRTQDPSAPRADQARQTGRGSGLRAPGLHRGRTRPGVGRRHDGDRHR